MTRRLPAEYGKFYPGRLDDSPVNHDLLWRTTCKAEDDIFAMYEDRALRSQWTDTTDRRLLEALRVHGGAVIERWMQTGQGEVPEDLWPKVMSDDNFFDVTECHTRGDCEHRARQLHA